MIKISEKTFFLTDTEGNEVPWSVTDLQSELIYCFVSTGVAQNSCFAEDVALAVEYSLQQAEENGGRISTAEMTDIVIKTLENAGFCNVAECFRKRNSRELEVLYSVNAECLKHLALQHGLFGQSADNESVISGAADAFAAMKIEQAPLGLVIEMLRYFYRHKQSSGRINIPAKKKIKGDYLFYYKDIVNEIPEKMKELVESGAVRVNDVTVYHPSIRIYLDIMSFAELCNAKPVLTEMCWSVYGNELGQSFDALIEAMQKKYAAIGGGRDLPVYLTINNMERFAAHYFGVVDSEDDELAKFVVADLAANMFNTFYKVRF